MGRIFVVCCKRRAVWGLSVSKLKLLKSFQEGRCSRNGISACWKSEYVTWGWFPWSLEEKRRMVSSLCRCFCCAASCVIPADTSL